MYRSLLRGCFSNQVKRQGGKLYVWRGKEQVIAFDQEFVTKVALGNQHHAFITDNGNLYTLGKNQYGQLGHNHTNSVKTQPKCVEFFRNNNLRVVDVSIGESHTLALTHDGDVWSFGRGNKRVSLLMKMFMNTVGALGHPDKISHSTPHPIEALRSLPSVVHISSGRIFNTIINNQQQVYNWGRGELSVFGNGSNKNYLTPTLNSHFEYLRKEEGLTIKKIRSCNNFSMVLMSNNRLYGWGHNEFGQLGTNQTGGQMYETYYYPTQTSMEGIQDRKVVDFDVSQNTMIMILDNKDIYWNGRKSVFKPQKLLMPSFESPPIIAAGSNSIAVVSGDNIYTRWNFLQKSTAAQKNHPENLTTGIVKIPVSQAFEGATEVVRLGGRHGHGYAIVN